MSGESKESKVDEGMKLPKGKRLVSPPKSSFFRSSAACSPPASPVDSDEEDGADLPPDLSITPEADNANLAKQPMECANWLRQRMLRSTRRSGLNTYEDAFDGATVVRWLLQGGIVATSEAATSEANELLQKGFIQYCNKKKAGKPFSPKTSALYRFTALSVAVTALPATASHESGFLKHLKRSGPQPRFVSLNSQSGCLALYLNQESVFPLEIVALTQILFCELTGKRKRTLMLVCWDRVLKLKAETTEAAKKWLDAIEQGIDAAKAMNPLATLLSPTHSREPMDPVLSEFPPCDLEIEFFQMLTPTAQYLSTHPQHFSRLAAEFPSADRVLETLIDVLLNPVCPPDNDLVPCASMRADYDGRLAQQFKKKLVRPLSSSRVERITAASTGAVSIDLDDANAVRAHLFNWMMAHGEFARLLDATVLSSRCGVPLAWTLYQRLFHKQFAFCISPAQQEHWRIRFASDCDACVLAADKFEKLFLMKASTDRTFGNSLLNVLVQEPRRFCLDLSDPDVKSINCLGRTVYNSGIWSPLLKWLAKAPLQIRRHLLKEVLSCVITNQGNAVTLLTYEMWPEWVLSLLSDIPSEIFCGREVEPGAAHLRSHMERVWIVVLSVISELVRVCFSAEGKSWRSSDCKDPTDSAVLLDFGAVLTKCFTAALWHSACEPAQSRLYLPRSMLSSVIACLRKKLHNRKLTIEGVYWSKLTFLANFVKNFLFSYVSVMMVVTDETGQKSVAPLLAAMTPVPSVVLNESPGRGSRSNSTAGKRPDRRGSDLGHHTQVRNSPERSPIAMPQMLVPRRVSKSDGIYINDVASGLIQRGLTKYYHGSFDLHPINDIPADRALLRSLKLLLMASDVYSDVRKPQTTERRKSVQDFVESTSDQVAFLASTVDLNRMGNEKLSTEDKEHLAGLQACVAWLSDVSVFMAMLGARFLALSHLERLALIQQVRTSKKRHKVFRARAKLEGGQAMDPSNHGSAQESWPHRRQASVMMDVLVQDRVGNESLWPSAAKEQRDLPMLSLVDLQQLMTEKAQRLKDVIVAHKSSLGVTPASSGLPPSPVALHKYIAGREGPPSPRPSESHPAIVGLPGNLSPRPSETLFPALISLRSPDHLPHTPPLSSPPSPRLSDNASPRPSETHIHTPLFPPDMNLATYTTTTTTTPTTTSTTSETTTTTTTSTTTSTSTSTSTSA